MNLAGLIVRAVLTAIYVIVQLPTTILHMIEESA